MADSPMQELLVDQLRDLYDAEKQLTKALPKLAKAADDEELKQGFRDHLEQTKGHVQRIEQIFEGMDMRAKSKPCAAMKGLVTEGQETIDEGMEAPAGDIGLIAAARRVEHYEMAAYETLLIVAQASKQSEAAQLIQETLREEVETDKKLAAIAKRLAKEAGRTRPPADAAETKPAGKSSSGSVASKKAAPASNGSKSAAKSASKSSAQATGNKRSASTGGGSGEHLSHTSSDHDEIREWAEERGGKPSCVRGTGGKGDIGLLRIEFPGKPGANDDKLEEISWDDFFEKFDERGLALVYQEHTADGQISNFNKLITREGSTPSKSRSAH